MTVTHASRNLRQTRWNDVQELTPTDPTVGRLEGRPGLARITVFRRLSHTHRTRGARFAQLITRERYLNYARKSHHWGIDDSQRNKYWKMISKNYQASWRRKEKRNKKSIWFLRINFDVKNHVPKIALFLIIVSLFADVKKWWKEFIKKLLIFWHLHLALLI